MPDARGVTEVNGVKGMVISEVANGACMKVGRALA
jgi:hypothetical protein